MPGNGFGRSVVTLDSPGPVGRRETTCQAVNHMLAECLEMSDPVGRPFQPDVGALQSIGQRAAQKSDSEEQKDIEARRVSRHTRGREAGAVLQSWNAGEA